MTDSCGCPSYAAISRRSTKAWEQRIKDGRVAMLKMPVLPVQGGIPVMYQGVCVGGTGASGVASHEDEQIAQAGADVLAA